MLRNAAESPAIATLNLYAKRFMTGSLARTPSSGRPTGAALAPRSIGTNALASAPLAAEAMDEPWPRDNDNEQGGKKNRCGHESALPPVHHAAVPATLAAAVVGLSVHERDHVGDQ
jgi:hypothetical protein